MPILDAQLDLLHQHAGGADAGGAARDEWEDVVAAELAVFRQIKRSQDSYRSTAPYSEDVERLFHERYARWLAAARGTLDRLDRGGPTGAAVPGIDELRASCRQAEILALGTDTSDEAVAAMERAAPSPDAFRALAATRRPPQEWYDQDDRAFPPERG